MTASAERLGTTWRARLPGGLTVVVEPRQGAPVVALQIWVAVGSGDEAPGEEGLAHLHEHMLFKGTARYGVGEIAKAIESVGGDINAWTSVDHTVYHVILPVRDLQVGLEVLAEAVLRPAFDPTELEREKAVVLEEIKRTRDVPGRWVGDLLFEATFQGHPFGHPILGTAESVSAATRDSIRRFFDRHYRQERMALVVVGDVDPTEIVELALALWPVGQPASAEPREFPPPTKREVLIVPDDIHEVHLGIAWQIPGALDPDVPALDLLSMILGQGESARLLLRLKHGRELCNDAYAYAYTPLGAGLLALGASLETEKIAQTLEALGHEVGLLHQQLISPAELHKVKALAESDSIYLRETVQGVARRLGLNHLLMGDPHYGDRYLSQILAVTPDDLRRVARHYLVPERFAAVVLGPRPGLEGLSAQSIGEAFRAGFEAGRAVTESKPEAIERVKLRHGPVVILEPDSRVPLVALRAAFLGGSRYEVAANAGISNLLASLLTRGTDSRKAEEISQEIDQIAGNLEGFAGRNSIGLRAEFPSRHLERGLNLFMDCILHPIFPEREVRRERELTLQAILHREDNLSGLAFDLFAEALYPSHPYRLPSLGTEKSVSRVKRSNLQTFFAEHLTPGRMVLAAVGDFDPEELIARLKGILGELSRPASGSKPTIGLDPRPESPRSVFRERARSQAHLVLGFMGATIQSPDRFALEVLMTLLTGQSGRLFLELRDRRSLAYDVSGLSFEGIEPGSLAFYLAVDPSRLNEAHAALLTELRRIVREPPEAEELERARRFLIGNQAISLQRNGARAAVLALNTLYGLGTKEHVEYPERINAVSRDDVLRVARKYLLLGSPTVVVIGPEAMPDASAAPSAQD